METDNIYTAYKRDTKHLLYWLIKVSNSIIESPKHDSAGTKPNTTGQVTVAGILSMAQLIARHILPSEVPRLVSYLFRTVIRARTITYEAFMQLEVQETEPGTELKKSNSMHKHFIDILAEAFKALGGSDKLPEYKNGANTAQQPDKNDLEELVQFANKFSALSVDGAEDSQHSTDTDSDTEDADHQASKKQPKKGKGKKERASATRSLNQVPFDSYCITEDGDGLNANYLMAVHALAREWIHLREYVQFTWYQVAYEGLNSAVAAAVSNIAIAMIKRSELALAIDFPSHDDYPTILRTLTRGKDSADSGVLMGALGPKAKDGKDADVKEQLLIHTYNDLLDFIGDYQKTRGTGKSTERMAAQIDNWDLRYDLEQASDKQRIKWRRAYTINWLYDLVNIFASPVIFQNVAREGNYAYEKVDWSADGRWGSRVRVLLGLNDFAAAITSFAMQKPGTDVRHKIMTHHVFQLQCIVDAFTASRGWFVTFSLGHGVFGPADSFCPRRDIDLFLNRKDGLFDRGWLQSARILGPLFDAEDIHRDSLHPNPPSRLTPFWGYLKQVGTNFIKWLGEAKNMREPGPTQPVRFHRVKSNGFWDFSPYACGAGLMEALDISYSLGLVLLDKIAEPILLLFFKDGKRPTSQFVEAFDSHIKAVHSRKNLSQFHLGRQSVAGSFKASRSIQTMFDPSYNLLFKSESVLTALRRANWNHDRIPDEAVTFGSRLFVLRVSQTRHTFDPTTGKPRLQDTPLVERARKEGLPDDFLLPMSNAVRDNFQPINDHAAGTVHAEHDTSESPKPRFGGPTLGDRFRFLPSHAQEVDYPARILLRDLKVDLHNDIAAHRPLSGINLLGIIVRSVSMFRQIEDRLKEKRNHVYTWFYEAKSGLRLEERRSLLSTNQLTEQDDECMRVMAETFEGIGSGVNNHMYWDPSPYEFGYEHIREGDLDEDDTDEEEKSEDGGDGDEVKDGGDGAL
ncbi:hypothetical protein PG990_002700 [Apiospora arundinis]